MRTATNHAGYCVEIFHRRTGWGVCSPIYVSQQRAIDVMKSLQHHRAMIRAKRVANGLPLYPATEYRIYSALEMADPVERSPMREWMQAIEDSVIAARVFFACSGSKNETTNENETA